MTHADINDLETRDYIFKIGDREKAIQARYDENTDALIFPRAPFDYVCKLLNEALSQEPKSGKWIWSDEIDRYVCDKCGQSDGKDKEMVESGEYPLSNYCHNCGAKMENAE